MLAGVDWQTWRLRMGSCGRRRMWGAHATPQARLTNPLGTTPLQCDAARDSEKRVDVEESSSKTSLLLL
eukprot:3750840-Pyramimonas_sp.AAC.1